VERPTRHLELAIDIGSDPISGSVTNGAQRSQPFIGWIELTAAIEAARSTGETGRETLGSLPGAKATEL
jgi:hypothetical protein